MKPSSTATRRLGVGLFALVAAVSIMRLPHAAAQTTAPGSIDYLELFKTKVMPCIHPTVKPDTVTVELRKEPTTSGDTTTARVEAFYKGLIKKNSIQADIMIRQAGSIRQLKVNVLSDTSAVHGSCDLTSNWQDF
jgi:hypothetical protein